jgi:hypothetical protein
MDEEPRHRCAACGELIAPDEGVVAAPAIEIRTMGEEQQPVTIFGPADRYHAGHEPADSRIDEHF